MRLQFHLELLYFSMLKTVFFLTYVFNIQSVTEFQLFYSVTSIKIAIRKYECILFQVFLPMEAPIQIQHQCKETLRI